MTANAQPKRLTPDQLADAALALENCEKAQSGESEYTDALRDHIAALDAELDAAEARAAAYGDSLNAEARAHDETLAKLQACEQANKELADTANRMLALMGKTAETTTPYTLENGLIFGPDGDSFATVDAIREHDAALLVHFANKAYTLTEYEQRRDAPPPARNNRADAAEGLLRIAKEALRNIATKEYTRWPIDGDELDASDVAHDALSHLDTPPAATPARPRPGVITGSSRQDGPLESPAEVSKRLASEFVNSARAALAPTPAYTLENGLIFGPDGDSFATVDAIREHDAALLVHFANKAYTLTEYEQRRDAPPPARNNRADAAEGLLRAVLQHRITGTVGMFIVPDALLHRIAAALNREAAA